MTSFIVNDPRATGYTLFWDHGPKYIHTHLAGEDTAALYEQFADNDVLYMPVDAGELVTEIWQRTLYQPYQWAIGVSRWRRVPKPTIRIPPGLTWAVLDQQGTGLCRRCPLRI